MYTEQNRLNLNNNVDWNTVSLSSIIRLKFTYYVNVIATHDSAHHIALNDVPLSQKL